MVKPSYLVMLFICICLIDSDWHGLDLGDKISKFSGLVLDISISELGQLYLKTRFWL